MTRPDTARKIPNRDPQAVILDLMRTLAISVLDEHSNATGIRVVCSSAWPCEPVAVAAHNLAVI